MISLLSAARLSGETWDCVLPRQRVRTFDWIEKNVRMPDGTPINVQDYPWIAGICDEWDNPRRREIWLQFCARIGKTALAQSMMICSIATNPAPAIFGTSTHDLAKQTVRKKYEPMLEYCEATRRWLLPPHRRMQTRIDLTHSCIYVAWSGSPTKLSDLAARYSHAGEIDKWTKQQSDEADPLMLFLERGIEIPDRKILLESTPTFTGRSRVNRGYVRTA